MTSKRLTVLRAIRAKVRELAGVPASDRRSIVVVEGSGICRAAGSSYCHTTPSGRTIVRRPGAYGWRTQYHPSTRRIEVSADVLAVLYDELEERYGPIDREMRL